MIFWLRLLLLLLFNGRIVQARLSKPWRDTFVCTLLPHAIGGVAKPKICKNEKEEEMKTINRNGFKTQTGKSESNTTECQNSERCWVVDGECDDGDESRERNISTVPVVHWEKKNLSTIAAESMFPFELQKTCKIL